VHNGASAVLINTTIAQCTADEVHCRRGTMNTGGEDRNTSTREMLSLGDSLTTVTLASRSLCTLSRHVGGGRHKCLFCADTTPGVLCGASRATGRRWQG
jgi:hypothetical protein